jgi:hypothetical protein
MPQLTAAELQQVQSLLKDFAPAQAAIATLLHFEGDLETSLADLIAVEMSVALESLDRAKLRTIVLAHFQKEICQNWSLREQIQNYQQQLDQADVLISLLQELVATVSPDIDFAIATVLVLWIVQVGIDAFCE